MSLGIPAEVIAEFIKDGQFAGLLMEMQVSPATLRYTNIEENITYGGNTYSPLCFNIPDVESTSGFKADNLKVTLDNASLQPVSIFLNQENRGSLVIISAAILDRYGAPVQVAEFFRGYISQVSLPDTSKAEFTLINEFAWWNKDTLRVYDYNLCPHLADIELKPVYWGRPTPK